MKFNISKKAKIGKYFLKCPKILHNLYHKVDKKFFNEINLRDKSEYARAVRWDKEEKKWLEWAGGPTVGNEK